MLPTHFTLERIRQRYVNAYVSYTVTQIQSYPM
jgi:hypothetical protein